jgi:hypothetical protein
LRSHRRIEIGHDTFGKGNGCLSRSLKRATKLDVLQRHGVGDSATRTAALEMSRETNRILHRDLVIQPRRNQIDRLLAIHGTSPLTSDF